MMGLFRDIKADTALSMALVEQMHPRLAAQDSTLAPPREQIEIAATLAPARHVMARLGGAEWATTTTPKSLAKTQSPNVPLDDISTAWMITMGAVGHADALPDTRAPFAPAPKHKKLVKLLVQNGYMTESLGKVRWTDATAPAQIQSNRWASDGTSRTDRANAGVAARANDTTQKAQAILDTMPRALARDFASFTRTNTIFASYDWICAHYHDRQWHSTPRTLSRDSKPGNLNVPEMGISTAAEMYAITRGGS